MTNFLFGAIAVAAAIASLIFARFYRRTRDGFFVFFAVAFALQSVLNVLSVLTSTFNDETTTRFLLRLAEYLLILGGIAYKNASRRNTRH